MADGDQLAQLPSQISPQALATLFPGAQAPATPPIVSPPPGGPGAGSMEDYARLAATQQQQLLASGPAQEAERARSAGQEFAAKIGQTPLPQMTPQIDRSKGFLHNLGQTLQLISMITPTGREIFGPSGPVYGPKVAQYRATQAGLLGQKEAAEKAAEESGKEVGALAGVAGRTIYGGSRVEAEKISADQRAQAVLTQHQTALDRIAGMTDIAAKRNAAQVEIANIRAQVEREVSAAGNVTKEDVARILASNAQSLLNTKIAEDPSIAGAIKRAFGLGGAQAPGGAQPVGGAAPLPSRAPAKAAAPAKTPPRPKGVPPDAQYDPKTNTWFK